MTARDDAIEAIARALHADNCPDDVDRGEPCGCVDWDREAEVAYEAAEPIIRADERERAGVRQEDTVTAHDPFLPDARC